ncbi:MAG: hypothetical protein AAFY73_05575 [Pseudomonadota bacterium]
MFRQFLDPLEAAICRHIARQPIPLLAVADAAEATHEIVGGSDILDAIAKSIVENLDYYEYEVREGLFSEDEKSDVSFGIFLVEDYREHDGITDALQRLLVVIDETEAIICTTIQNKTM